MIQCPVDYIIVKLDKAFENEIFTPSGVKLYKDSYWCPEWNVTTKATVVSSPRRLSKRHELQGLSNEVNAGDTIICSYMVVFSMDIRDKDTPLHHNLFYYNGEYYWKCDYIHYLGKIVDGKIQAAQGRIFCEDVPSEEKELSSLIITPDMVKKAKPKGKGKVVSIGKNQDDREKLSVSEGDIIRYPDRFACRYDIEGKNYVILTQSCILATESV